MKPGSTTTLRLVVCVGLTVGADRVGGVLGAHAQDGKVGDEQALYPVLGSRGVVVPALQELAVRDAPSAVLALQTAKLR
jgi:hypothetical protein